MAKCAAFRKRNANQNTVPLYLAEVAQTWQTPSAADVTGGHLTRGGSRSDELLLNGQASKWQTPNVQQFNSRKQVGDTERQDLLGGQAAKWATPRGTDGTKGGPNQAGSKGDLMLPSQSAQWPTPAARDMKGANSAEHALVTGGGRKHMDQLANFVAHSPQAQAIQGGEPSSKDSPSSRRRLNPAFAAWLMGFPWWWTNPGVTSSAKSAMESYRSQQLARLSSLCGEPAVDKAA